MAKDQNIFDGPIGRKLECDLLTRTVEGCESSLAYSLTDGVPAMSAKGVTLRAPVDAKLLIDFLRSDRPLGRELRDWLADMLDRKTNANLTLSKRQGAPQSNMLQYLEAVEGYIDRRNSGDGYDAAVSHVAAEQKIKPGTLKKAIARLEEGIKIHRETRQHQ